MSKPIRSLVAAVLLAAMTASGDALADGADTSAEASPEAQAKSRELFRKGFKAYSQGKKQEAFEAFLGAWQLQKSFDVAGNLANVELELEPPKFRDAAEHAAFALGHLPPAAGDKQR